MKLAVIVAARASSRGRDRLSHGPADGQCQRYGVSPRTRGFTQTWADLLTSTLSAGAQHRFFELTMKFMTNEHNMSNLDELPLSNCDMQ